MKGNGQQSNGNGGQTENAHDLGSNPSPTTMLLRPE
jgi:hypothetical protein